MAIHTTGIRLSDLSKMPPEEQSRQLALLDQAANYPTPEQLKEQLSRMNKEIEYYERKYSVSSLEIKRKLQSGEVIETAEICSWVMLLNIKKSFEEKTRSSQP